MIDPCLILVADGTRARLLAVEQPENPAVDGGPHLVEHRSLVNPELDAKGRDLYSDTRSGMGRERSGALAHSYDDHRDQHESETQKRFAIRVAEETQALLHVCRARRLVVAAETRMLGFLRPALTRALGVGIEVHELARDLSRLQAHDLQERLAQEQLVPPRRPPESTTRSRFAR